MTIIVAAIAVGLLLLWGGILGLFKLVDLFEQKHFLGIGAYATLVCGLVIGLVLYSAHERQKAHQIELQQQMEAVSQRLNQLSEKLVNQLAEKADLTQSEMEIRVGLQNEKASHERTRKDLAAQNREYQDLKTAFNRERNLQRSYRDSIEKALDQRFIHEQERYEGIRDFLSIHQRNLQTNQKKLSAIQADLDKIQKEQNNLDKNQGALANRFKAAEAWQQQSDKRAAEVLRTQKGLTQALETIKTKVDSLYHWKGK